MAIRRLNIGYEGRAYEDRWVVIDTEMLKPWPDHDRLRFRCDPTRPAVDCPTPLGRHRWEFPILPGDDEEYLTTDDAIYAMVSRYGISRDSIKILRATVYSHHVRFAARFRMGRVFLAGDTTHAMPPWIGQGMAAGVRDVANLCWKLAAVLRGELPETVAADERHRFGVRCRPPRLRRHRDQPLRGLAPLRYRGHRHASRRPRLRSDAVPARRPGVPLPAPARARRGRRHHRLAHRRPHDLRADRGPYPRPRRPRRRRHRGGSRSAGRRAHRLRRPPDRLLNETISGVKLKIRFLRVNERHHSIAIVAVRGLPKHLGHKPVGQTIIDKLDQFRLGALSLAHPENTVSALSGAGIPDD